MVPRRCEDVVAVKLHSIYIRFPNICKAKLFDMLIKFWTDVSAIIAAYVALTSGTLLSMGRWSRTVKFS